MVDKIDTISKFKGYVQSALLSHAHKLEVFHATAQ